MCDHHQCAGALERAVQALLERFGIEGGKALVEDRELCFLEQGAREEDPAFNKVVTIKHIERGDVVRGSGTLEVLPDGYVFLRSAAHNYLASPEVVL